MRGGRLARDRPSSLGRGGTRLVVEGGESSPSSRGPRARNHRRGPRAVLQHAGPGRIPTRGGEVLQHLRRRSRPLRSSGRTSPSAAAWRREILNLRVARRAGRAEDRHLAVARRRMRAIVETEPLGRLAVSGPAGGLARPRRRAGVLRQRPLGPEPAPAQALSQAYGNLLRSEPLPFAGRPWGRPARVDVNVHPTKREVRFSSERDLFPALVGGLKRVVIGHVPVWRPSAPRGPGYRTDDAPPAAGTMRLFDSPFSPLPRDGEDRPVDAPLISTPRRIRAPPRRCARASTRSPRSARSTPARAWRATARPSGKAPARRTCRRGKRTRPTCGNSTAPTSWLRSRGDCSSSTSMPRTSACCSRRRCCACVPVAPRGSSSCFPATHGGGVPHAARSRSRTREDRLRHRHVRRHDGAGAVHPRGAGALAGRRAAARPDRLLRRAGGGRLWSLAGGKGGARVRLPLRGQVRRTPDGPGI